MCVNGFLLLQKIGIFKTTPCDSTRGRVRHFPKVQSQYSFGYNAACIRHDRAVPCRSARRLVPYSDDGHPTFDLNTGKLVQYYDTVLRRCRKLTFYIAASVWRYHVDNFMLYEHGKISLKDVCGVYFYSELIIHSLNSRSCSRNGFWIGIERATTSLIWVYLAWISSLAAWLIIAISSEWPLSPILSISTCTSSTIHLSTASNRFTLAHEKVLFMATVNLGVLP